MGDPVDSQLVIRVVEKLAEPPSYAPEGAAGSILTAAAASFGIRPSHDELTQPTGFDPEAAALFEAIVESAYLVAMAGGTFDGLERQAFRQVVLTACGGAVLEPQVDELLGDLAARLVGQGLDQRIAAVAGAVRRGVHAHEVLRISVLIARVSGGVRAPEREVLDRLARGFDVSPEAVARTLDAAERA